MALPIGTLVFSGFGDAPIECTDAAGNSVTPPPDASIGNTTAFGGTNGCTGLVSLGPNRYFVVGTSYNEPPDQIVEAILDATFNGYIYAVPNTAPPYVTHGQTSGAAADSLGNGYWLAGSSSHSPAIRKTTPLGAVTVVGSIGGTDSYALGRLGVNPSATIAYYALRTEQTVHRWNIQNDVALSDFVTVTGGGGNNIGAICVLPDDSVLIGWDSGTSAGSVVRYNAAGSVLHTYTLPDTYQVATWITPAVNTNTGALVFDRFFVAYYSSAAGYGVTVCEVNTSSGAIVNTFATPTIVTPNGDFEWDGPFVLTREGPTPPTPAPPDASISIPMRKLRRSTTYSTEKLWNFFTRFQLDFQAGGPRAGSEPIEICLRYSDDSGNTWSDELWQTVDHKGDYSAIAQWFQLGRGRDRVWEVSSTSDAMTVWLAAYLDVIPGSHG